MNLRRFLQAYDRGNVSTGNELAPTQLAFGSQFVRANKTRYMLYLAYKRAK